MENKVKEGKEIKKKKTKEEKSISFYTEKKKKSFKYILFLKRVLWTKKGPHILNLTSSADASMVGPTN